MPTFQYTELDKRGKILNGNMIAADKSEVIHNLRAKGSKVLKIIEREEQSKDVRNIQLFAPKVTTKDIYLFCRQMYTMLSAGMPLLNAVAVMEKQAENKTLKRIYFEMQIDLQKGLVFSQAVRKHKQFPPLLVNMIESGELTGNLDEVLQKMSIHYEKENKINAKIRAAMIYPIILGLVSVGVMTFILTKVMPMFIGIFKDAGIELPMITQIFVGLSDFMVGYWYLILIAIAALIVLFRRFVATKNGKKAWDRFCMKLPAVKGPLQMIYTSRFTRTLSTLLGSGISILDAFRSAARVTNNQVIIDDIDEAAESVKKGEAVSTTLARLHLFPMMMISMIGIGEESGSIEEMLGKTADYYDQELDEAITKLVALMEPALIVVLGIVVGFSVIAMLLPMFDMTSAIK